MKWGEGRWGRWGDGRGVRTGEGARQRGRWRVCGGWEGAPAAPRIDPQPPQADKLARADVVIHTDGLMADTQAQFEAAWEWN